MLPPTPSPTQPYLSTPPRSWVHRCKSVDEEDALAFMLSASGADSDSLTYSATNLPAGASFDTASGAFSWTSADAGTYVVIFEVTDGYLSDSEVVTITVLGRLI